jgi:hypothetical protein
MNFFERMGAKHGEQSRGGGAASFPQPRPTSRSTFLPPQPRTSTTGQGRMVTTGRGCGQSQALMQRPASVQQKQQEKQKQADATQQQGVISMEEGTSFPNATARYGTNSTRKLMNISSHILLPLSLYYSYEGSSRPRTATARVATEASTCAGDQAASYRVPRHLGNESRASQIPEWSESCRAFPHAQPLVQGAAIVGNGTLV